MESSQHEFSDTGGYRCAVEFLDETNDMVVFGSTPQLSFDFASQNIRISRRYPYHYKLVYVLTDDGLFLRAVLTCPVFWQRHKTIFGASPQRFGNSRWALYAFDDVFVPYTGKLHVGRSFNMDFWPQNDKVEEILFVPEAYKQTGYAVLENGKLTGICWDNA